MKLLWLLAFVGALQLCIGAKILTIVPMPARSHHNLLERLAVELAKKGHEVTFVTPFKQSKPVKNLKEIILPDLHEKLSSLKKEENNVPNNMFDQRHMPVWMTLLVYPKMGAMLMEGILETPELQGLINGDEKFDLILGEAFLDESLLAGFSYKYKAPIVALATFMPNTWPNYMVGNPAPAAYIPDPQLGFPTKMTFLQRVENFLFTTAEEINHKTRHLKVQDEIMRKFFGEDLPPIEDIITNTSLVLVNHHYSLAFPRPLLPNMVEIGGFHINPPKPLPSDLQKYFDESKDGVIYFSMGSNLKSAQMSKEMKETILKAFSRLKQNVLWKFEDDTLTDLPKNVKIQKWCPQSDILAHPNVKLFITHGGLLSTTEAIYRGVPVVGIPIFGDQPTNMRYTEAAGFGLTLNFDDLNEDALYNAITEVVSNPKYKENVMRKSLLLQDLPMSALDTALYWIEYVIRHKGAPHLKSAAQDLKWYQLYLLDVIGVFLLITVPIIYISCKVTKCVIKRILGLACKKGKKASKEKKEN